MGGIGRGNTERRGTGFVQTLLPVELVGPRGRLVVLSGHPIASSVLPASQRAGGGPCAWEGSTHSPGSQPDGLAETWATHRWRALSLSESPSPLSLGPPKAVGQGKRGSYHI